MCKLIYSMSVSLDGYICGPQGDFDWSAPDEELHRFHNDQVRELGGHLLGRRLYEVMSYWETADERVRAVPLVAAEVFVEVVGDGEPRDVLPAHPGLEPLDIGLRRGRGVHERGVAGVEMGEVAHVVSHQRAADAGMFGPAVNVGLEERAVHDQLTATAEKVEQARPALGPVEDVVLPHRRPRHPSTLRGQRIPRTAHLLLQATTITIDASGALLGGGTSLLRPAGTPAAFRSLRW
jgi:hypothetical protein